MSTTVNLPSLLNQQEVASYLDKSIAWCERARWDGSGPPYIKVGRAVRYRADDLLAWIEENAHRHSGERGR